MITRERTNLVAPCGIDCGTCELYMCKDNQPLLDYLITKGVPRERIPCAGCRDITGDCPVSESQDPGMLKHHGSVGCVHRWFTQPMNNTSTYSKVVHAQTISQKIRAFYAWTPLINFFKHLSFCSAHRTRLGCLLF